MPLMASEVDLAAKNLADGFVAPHWKKVASKKLAPGFYYYRNVLTGESSWDLNEVMAKARAARDRQEAAAHAAVPEAANESRGEPRVDDSDDEFDDVQSKKLAGKLYLFACDLIELYSPARGSKLSVTRDLGVFGRKGRKFGGVRQFALANTFSLDAKTDASVSLKSYIERIVVYTELPYQCFYVAMAYVARLCKSMLLSPTERNMYKMMLTASLVAGKFLVDARFSNGFFAQVGGLKPKQLNELEYNFLTLLEWELDLSDEQLTRIHELVDTRSEGSGIGASASIESNGAGAGVGVASGSDADKSTNAVPVPPRGIDHGNQHQITADALDFCV